MLWTRPIYIPKSLTFSFLWVLKSIIFSFSLPHKKGLRESYYSRHERRIRKPVLETYKKLHVKETYMWNFTLLSYKSCLDIFPQPHSFRVSLPETTRNYSVGWNMERKVTFSASNTFSPFQSMKWANKIIWVSSKKRFSSAPLPSLLISSSDKQ